MLSFILLNFNFIINKNISHYQNLSKVWHDKVMTEYQFSILIGYLQIVPVARVRVLCVFINWIEI